MSSINLTNAASGEVTQLVINESLVVGQSFRLIGRNVMFIARKVYVHQVAGPMVIGDSACGYRTGARVCDTARA